jgi:small-conductance mechanosensitive channel
MEFAISLLTNPAFLPIWATAIIAAAIAAALILHRIAYTLLSRLLDNSGFLTLLRVVNRTRGPSRLALVMLALAIVLPLAPINPTLGEVLSRVMRIAFIALLAWIATVAVDIFTHVYLRRFRIDVEDNLVARKHTTQVHILKRATEVTILLIAVASALMTFDEVRQLGLSLFASAGVAGLAIGLAARPLLSNLIAGIQIAMAQPIRIDDVVIVEGEYGTVEEIRSAYVVLKLWDWRRMIVPLNYFIEKPFQNWTRESSSIIGTVMIEADYTAPVERIRAKLTEIVRASKLWDRAVVNLQVVEAKEATIKLRALVSARTAPIAWDLQCEVREKLISFLQSEFPHALPQRRLVMSEGDADTARLQPFEEPARGERKRAHHGSAE